MFTVACLTAAYATANPPKRKLVVLTGIASGRWNPVHLSAIRKWESSPLSSLQRGRPTGARLVGERSGDQASDTGRAAAAPRGFGPGERAGPGELL